MSFIQLPRRLSLILLLMSASFSLMACVSSPQIPPNSTILPSHYPPQNGAAFDDKIDTNNAAAIAFNSSWKSVFIDPTLQHFIAQALINNSDLAVANARIAEARAMYRIQNAERFPTLGASANGTRSRTPADLSVTQQPMLGNQFQVGLNVMSYELDFWGRVANLNAAAIANFMATQEAQQAYALSLIGMVANTYLQQIEFNERILLAQKTVQSRQESRRIMQLRVDIGSNSDFELRQVETLLLSTLGELAALERQRAQNKALLLQLTGAFSNEQATHNAIEQANNPAPTLANQGLNRAIAVGIPADLLLQRPDLRAAEQQLLASAANINAARAAFFPKITLTGSAGTASAEMDNLFHSGSSAWQLLPSMSLPIFDSGRTQSQLDLAKARQQIALANYQSKIKNAFKETADALAAHQWLNTQRLHQTALVKAETERARLAQLRYEHGTIAYLEVLDAERALFTTEQTLVQLNRSALSATVNLYIALGGGQDAQLLAPLATTSIPSNTPLSSEK